MAESPGFDVAAKYKVHTALPTTNNEWAITVTYCADSCHSWYISVLVAWTILSIMISSLVYMIFSQKQFHADAMAAKSALMFETATRSAQVERELNDFIAHEVRTVQCLHETVASTITQKQ